VSRGNNFHYFCPFVVLHYSRNQANNYFRIRYYYSITELSIAHGKSVRKSVKRLRREMIYRYIALYINNERRASNRSSSFYYATGMKSRFHIVLTACKRFNYRVLKLKRNIRNEIKVIYAQYRSIVLPPAVNLGRKSCRVSTAENFA
jgi:hypothetical protein